MQNQSNDHPPLYHELAGWWPVLSPVSDYADEALFFGKLFEEAGAKTLLELGAGGGNVAWYLKKNFQLTLTDLSPDMLAVSQELNPECEHVVGDMRELRLGKRFDGVFIHDAIMYMLTEQDLLAAFKTAYAHCKPGGLVVIAPDCTRETFEENTLYEGHDMEPPDMRSVRYMEWSSDPDPTDTLFSCDYIIALKEGDFLRTVVDRQICGLFPRQRWLELLDQAGFESRMIEDGSSAGKESERTDLFLGTRKP
jgi:SAM-dependent methyltransferase